MHPPYLPLCVPCTSKIEFCHHLFIAAILSRHSVSGDHNKYCCLSHSFPTHMVNVHHLSHICRDLRVENMLLDTNMNIKLIGENSKCLIILLAILIISAAFIFLCPDFGLSNEEFIESEHGPVHCNTQCGAPAYTAPEVLGHKEYGKEVDIWSMWVQDLVSWL